MIQIVLIVVSVLIIVTIVTSLHKESKNKDNNYFDKIFEQEYESSERLIIEEKRRFFLDKVLNEIRSTKCVRVYDNYNLIKTNMVKPKDTSIKQESEISLQIKHLMNKGYNDVEICKMLDIGKGELSLIKRCYKI